MTDSNVIFLKNGNIKPNVITYGDQVLLAIFEKSFGRGVGCGSAEQFRETHPNLVEAALKTLSLLELVEPDQSSPWGYRPTHGLTEQLLDPLIDHDKEHPAEEDRKLLTKIIEASGKPELWEGGKSISNMLVVLWFAHWNQTTGHLIIYDSLHMQMISAGHFDEDDA
jgi:hypothetical protein